MPVHKVTASMNVLELSKAGSAIELSITADGETLGTIRIGKGSLGWKGKGKKKYNDISWSKFAGMMDDKFYPEQL